MIKPLHLLALLLLAAACWQCAAEAKSESTNPIQTEAATQQQEANTKLRSFSTLVAEPQDYESSIPITGRITAV